ncbi:hypothetical protein HPB51_020983 [Rhipicephalus microplus]|uniref:Uncharacterized protein n=1 Tax=Rhipicephalus microplus TaxID=6941 RepID=A0A9J6DW69_RHIMP|nr:hypothetical protein HPB51_020983 [Rhipicephalus microplus]
MCLYMRIAFGIHKPPSARLESEDKAPTPCTNSRGRLRRGARPEQLGASRRQREMEEAGAAGPAAAIRLASSQGDPVPWAALLASHTHIAIHNTREPCAKRPSGSDRQARGPGNGGIDVGLQPPAVVYACTNTGMRRRFLFRIQRHLGGEGQIETRMRPALYGLAGQHARRSLTHMTYAGCLEGTVRFEGKQKTEVRTAAGWQTGLSLVKMPLSHDPPSLSPDGESQKSLHNLDTTMKR